MCIELLQQLAIKHCISVYSVLQPTTVLFSCCKILHLSSLIAASNKHCYEVPMQIKRIKSADIRCCTIYIVRFNYLFKINVVLYLTSNVNFHLLVHQPNNKKCSRKRFIGMYCYC